MSTLSWPWSMRKIYYASLWRTRFISTWDSMMSWRINSKRLRSAIAISIGEMFLPFWFLFRLQYYWHLAYLIQTQDTWRSNLQWTCLFSQSKPYTCDCTSRKLQHFSRSWRIIFTTNTKSTGSERELPLYWCLHAFCSATLPISLSMPQTFFTISARISM